MFWNFQPSLCRELGLLCPKTAKAFAERFKQRLSILNKLPSMIEALSNTKSLVKPCYLAYSMRQLTTAIWQIKANDTPVMHQRVSTKSAGFTLIELLVVILLLAIVSTVSVVSLDGVQDEPMADVTKFEMQELKKALLQFRLDNRAFPCGVYRVAGEDKRPYMLDEVNMDYKELPTGTVTAAQREGWCNGTTNPEHNALQMLMKFPYVISSTYYSSNTDDVATLHPLWSADLKRGWRGPYLSSAEGLKDAWGGYYRLLDPELDFPAYDPDKLWCGLDVIGSSYQCDDENDSDATFIDKPGNYARIVSYGPNGVYGGPNTTNPDTLDPDPCLPNKNDDDQVLCLLK